MELPGQRVGRAAWIGSRGEHARLRIAMRDYGADAARADLRHAMAERAEPGPGALGNPRLHVELAWLVDAGIERVDEGLRGEERRLHGLLRIHPEEQHVEHELEIGLGLVVAARAADGHGGHAALADQIAHERGAWAPAWGERVLMPLFEDEHLAARAQRTAELRRKDGLAEDAAARGETDHVAVAVDGRDVRGAVGGHGSARLARPPRRRARHVTAAPRIARGRLLGDGAVHADELCTLAQIGGGE